MICFWNVVYIFLHWHNHICSSPTNTIPFQNPFTFVFAGMFVPLRLIGLLAWGGVWRDGGGGGSCGLGGISGPWITFLWLHHRKKIQPLFASDHKLSCPTERNGALQPFPNPWRHVKETSFIQVTLAAVSSLEDWSWHIQKKSCGVKAVGLKAWLLVSCFFFVCFLLVQRFRLHNKSLIHSDFIFVW